MAQQQPLIFDLGVHIGKDSLYYLQKGFRVVGVEANPTLIEPLQTKFSNYLDNGQFKLVNRAISNVNNETISFYINQQQTDWGTTSSTWNRSMNANFTHVSVFSMTPKQLFDTYGIPYYLKIDIEGADVLILDELISRNAKPKYLSIELLTPHNYGIGVDVDHMAILNKLKVLGYTNFVLYNQAAQRHVPTHSLEGADIEYEFDGHCSGIFGKDIFANYPTTPIDDIMKAYDDYFTNVHNNDLFNLQSWFDIHCS